MGAQVPLRYCDYLRWQAVMCLLVGGVHVVCGIPGVFVHQRDSGMLLAGPIAVALTGLAGVRRGGSPVRAGTWFAPRTVASPSTGALGARRALAQMSILA